MQGGRRAVEVRGEEVYAAVFAGGEEGGEPLGSGGSAGYYTKLGVRVCRVTCWGAKFIAEGF